MDCADVLIVGGGIVGSAVAYFLSTDPGFRGRSIAIVERDTSYRQASTARSAGGLRQQFSTPENIGMSQVTLGMFRRLRTIFGAEADVGFREQGYLLLARAEGEPVLAENVKLQQSLNADTVLVSPGQMAKSLPWLSIADLAAGAFGRSGEGWFDPPSFAALMRAAAQGKGVTVIHDEVSALDIVGGRISGVRLASGAHVACDALVNGAGPWAGALAKLAGVALPVEPRKRTVYVIDSREPPAGLHYAPLTVDPSGVWFRPEGKLFLCGKSPEPDQEPPIGDLDAIDHGFFDAEVWPTLAARVPAFEAIKVVNAWSGYYDYNTLDQNAVIGPHPRIANLYFANGFSGHGAQHAAAAGRAIAELIAHGRFKTIDLSRLGYARIAANAPLIERNVI